MRIASSPSTAKMRTIRFKSFSSGSCGNCYFLGSFNGQVCECALLIDTGVSPRRLRKALQSEGLDLDCITSIFVTHDHYDHIRSLGSYCKGVCKPVYVTKELSKALSYKFIVGEYFNSCRRFLEPEVWNEIVPGRLRVRYFVVPHDATQTVGYAVELDGYRFAIMTDIGRVTPQVLEAATWAETVVIESNYDATMLRNGPYPEELQERIRSGHGHLSNAECAGAIKQFDHEGLRNVFLCHLSEHNNTPELALEDTRRALSEAVRLVALPRDTPSVMFIL